MVYCGLVLLVWFFGFAVWGCFALYSAGFGYLGWFLFGLFGSDCCAVSGWRFRLLIWIVVTFWFIQFGS